MIFQGLNQTSYDIYEDKIASGGEGTLHRIQGDDKHIAKIFKVDKRDAQREEKLRFMVQHRLSEEQLKQVTWPQDVIYDKDGFAGYIMPKIEYVSSLTEIYTSNIYDLRYRVLAAVNLCAAIDTVHEMGWVCGDLNPRNICINLNERDKDNAFKVTLVDTDSYHFTSGEKTYRCEVGQGEYIAPELQNKLGNDYDLRTVPLPSYTRETDLFALAVHIFYLLMNGCHPFACAKESNRKESNLPQMTGENTKESCVAPQLVENIQVGFFPFYEKKDGLVIPAYAPEFDYLPQKIRELFIRTFVEGHREAKNRVSAIEWKEELTPLLDNLVKCSSDSGHYYFEVGKGCPLCRVERKWTEFVAHQEPNLVINQEIINDSDDVTDDRVKESPKKSYMPIIFAIIGTAVVLTSIYFLFLKNDQWNSVKDKNEYAVQKEFEIETHNPEGNSGYEQYKQHEKSDEESNHSEKVTEDIIQNENSNSRNKKSAQEIRTSTPTPFYGIWCMATKKKGEAEKEAKLLKKRGMKAKVFVTTDWSNLNSEKWYVVSAGVYKSEDKAKIALGGVKKIYPNAYVKYSGDWKEE